MYLSSFRVFNYKSFFKTERIDLKPGINIILGQNNVGKTSLLDALTFNFNNEPHESRLSKPSANSVVENESVATFEVTVQPTEIEEVIRTNQSLAIKIPIQYASTVSLHLDESRQNKILHFLNSKLKTDCKLVGTYETTDKRIIEMSLVIDEEDADLDADWKYRQNEKQKNPCLVAHTFLSNELSKIEFQNGGAGLPRRSLDSFFGSIFKFDAKRVEVEKSPLGKGLILNSNCSNLASVINNLGTEHSDMYRELKELVSFVIPSVKDIMAPMDDNPSGAGFEYSLRISAFDPETRRVDLSKSLATCGTGVGQVLGLLFLIVTAETPRLILIDELQSFLHPGAVKKLLEIFNGRKIKHQYIITTHSPEVLNNAHPSNVILIDIDQGISKVKSVNSEDSDDLQEVFSNLGIKLSDYYFRHHIIWVEGETEKSIVPLLLEDRDDVGVMVLDTGIAYKNRKESVALACKLVSKMSVGENVPQRKVSIVFDNEKLTNEQITELKSISGDLLHFLPRMMTENYLLHPKAITELLNQLLETNEIDESETNKWIEEKASDGWININDSIKYISRENWLIQVHGANLLDKLFNEITNSRCNYSGSKRKFGEELVKWILENEASFLDELKNYYLSIIKT